MSKTFSTMDEYYTDEDEDDEGVVEVELEDSEEHEGIESFINEVISEEYDEVLSEIFHNSDGKPPLLN